MMRNPKVTLTTSNPEWLFEDKARFCLVTQIAPSEYDQMTRSEINAFIKMYSKLNKQK
jgi:hypothetical protein